MNKHSMKITGHMKRERYCKEKFPELYTEIMSHPGETYIEKLYNYSNGDPSHICICGNPTKFINYNKGYAKYCCPGCASKDPVVKSKKIQTTKEHYGVENPSQSSEIRTKKEQTNLERYGVKYYNNREQAKQTIMERYGVEHVMHSNELKEKLKRTNLERYGVEWGLSSQEIIDKADKTYINKYGGRGNASPYILSKTKRTKLARYGDENYNNRDLAKQTSIDRYGVAHYNNSAKSKQTKLERYGNENYVNKEKVKQTNLERYGVECVFQSEDIKSKAKQTKLERYGDENYVNMEKAKQTILEKYGVEYITQSQEIKDKVRATMNGKLINNFPNLNHAYYENGEKFYCMNCGECTKCDNTMYNIRAIDASRRKSYGLEICPIANPFSPISNTSIERFVKDILNEYNIEYIENDRSILGGRELDIYIPSKSLAIECNGTYWHSSKFHDDHKYHYNKYITCAEKDIQLLTIWSDQINTYPDKVRSIILSKLNIYTHKIYARKCIVKEISPFTSSQFIDTYHLQGNIRASYRLGLYYNNELISVMTFGKSRNCVSGGNSWELYRYAVKSGYQVIGGASKLYIYFMRSMNPNIVISFSSNDISNGNIYKQLGFNKTSDTIGYWYVKNNRRYHRYTFSKYKLIQLGYDSTKSEFEIMNDLGYDRIYDSGQTKWQMSIPMLYD